MRLLYRYIYYGAIYGIDLLRSKINHSFFKFQLYINKVQFQKVNVGTHLPYLRVSQNAKCVLGNNFSIISYFNTGWYSKSKILVGDKAELIIGDNTGINSTLIYCSKKISIGDNVKIGGGSRIYDTNFHAMDSILRANASTDGINAIKSPVCIGDNVFIGTGCIVSKGVSIGDNSIVAAGSVVVKSIPANEVWGGNPAKFIKKNE